MVNQKTKITDAELAEQIKSSHLGESQKTELLNLVKEMTGNERIELIRLILEANKDAKDLEKEEEELGKINEKYEEKLKEATHEETEYVRREYEKFDSAQDAGQFEELESEIAEMPENKPEIAKEMERPKVIKEKKHTLRNIILIAIGAVVIITGIILLISYL